MARKHSRKSTTDPAGKAALKARVREWEKKVKVEVGEIHVRLMTKKWASMTSDGSRLTLNTELLNQSPKFRDYVIVHELVHIHVPNHGKLFKTLMTVHLPGWEEIEKG